MKDLEGARREGARNASLFSKAQATSTQETTPRIDDVHEVMGREVRGARCNRGHHTVMAGVMPGCSPAHSEPRRPAHLATLLCAYERFSEIGGRTPS